MIVRVEMLAFCPENTYREVDISGRPVTLDSVFEMGQNDFQPMDLPSVSVGDVIYWDEKRYLVVGFGFCEITEVEYQDYKNTDRRDRSLKAIKMERNKNG